MSWFILNSDFLKMGGISTIKIIRNKEDRQTKLRREIVRKTGVLVVCVMIAAMSLGVFTILPRNAEAVTLYVGGTGPDNYTAIQSAIDDAEPGHTIYVYRGTYNEHIIISEAISLTGEDRDATIIDGNLTGRVVNVSARWVNITGFTVTRSGADPKDAGIALDHADNCYVADSNISDNYLGIFLDHSNDTALENNYVSVNSRNGVHLHYSSNVTITGSNISSNLDDGIRLRSSSNATVRNNTLSLNEGDGVDVRFSENIIISDNNISSNFRNGTDFYTTKNITIPNNHIWNNTEGMHFYFSSGSAIVNNTIVSNNGDAISLWDSNANTIAYNHIEKNFVFGILLLDSNMNTIVSNRVFGNRVIGIYLGASYRNTIAENNLSNNEFGIYLSQSKGNLVANNTAFSNDWMGIDISYSDNNIITNNAAAGNRVGIDISNTHNNTVNNNTAFLNEYYGIEVIRSSNILMADNTASSNGIDGFHLGMVTNSAVDNNTATYNNLSGIFLGHSNATAVTSNGAFTNNNSGIILQLSTNLTLTGNFVSMNPNGIILDRSNDTVVEYSNITENENGIYASYSNNNSITQNYIALNQWAGIFSHYSSGNRIEINNISSNAWYGIWLQFSNESRIEDCSIRNNYDGIRLYDSWNNTVSGNRILHNDGVGLGLELSSGNVLTNNVVQHSSLGVYANHSSDFNDFRRNLFSYNRDGVVLDESGNNTVVRNTVASNGDFGLSLHSCSDTHVFWNNFISNSIQAYDDRDANIWDNGYPSGGNYWSDYTGLDLFSGPNQDQVGSDGIGDEPYVIDADSRDRYPFMNPSVLPLPSQPKFLEATLKGSNKENITLIWSLSPDDGAGLMSVTSYEVYRSMTYDSEGSGYGLIASFPNGTSTFTDALVGEGDPNSYFYRVCAIDVLGNYSCAPNQAGKFTRPLSVGPNLVSIPLIQSNESVETVLQTVRFDKAWYYNSSSQEWNWYMTFKGYRRGLFNINHTMGIWVNVTENSNLTVAGIVPAQTTIHLYKGWNLVSFPSFNSSYTVFDLGMDSGVVRTEGYDSAPPYHLRVLGEGDVLLAGYGYWVRAKADTMWTIEVT